MGRGVHVRERRALPSGAGSPREGEARIAWWEGVASRPEGDPPSFAPESQRADEILASQSSVCSVRSDWRLITLKSK